MNAQQREAEIRERLKTGTPTPPRTDATRTARPKLSFPPLRKQFLYYRTAVRRWKQAGKPVRPDAEVNRIYDTICTACEFFHKGRCRVCGCRINRGKRGLLNKIRMATEECPLEEPKWVRWAGPPRRRRKRRRRTPK